MKSSSLAVAFILVNPSCLSAVLPLPCKFKTRARAVVPVELLGTWTITVRVKPFTLSDSVVEPGDVAPQPVAVVAAATVGVPAPKGTPRARRSMVVAATTVLTIRVVRNFEKRGVTLSPFISVRERRIRSDTTSTLRLPLPSNFNDRAAGRRKALLRGRGDEVVVTRSSIAGGLKAHEGRGARTIRHVKLPGRGDGRPARGTESAGLGARFNGLGAGEGLRQEGGERDRPRRIHPGQGLDGRPGQAHYLAGVIDEVGIERRAAFEIEGRLGRGRGRLAGVVRVDVVAQEDDGADQDPDQHRDDAEVA